MILLILNYQSWNPEIITFTNYYFKMAFLLKVGIKEHIIHFKVAIVFNSFLILLDCSTLIQELN